MSASGPAAPLAATVDLVSTWGFSYWGMHPCEYPVMRVLCLLFLEGVVISGLYESQLRQRAGLTL